MTHEDASRIAMIERTTRNALRGVSTVGHSLFESATADDSSELDGFIEPMLASPIELPLSAYANGQFVLEEKLDGSRCVVRVYADGTQKAWSRPRAGKDANRREVQPHMRPVLAQLPPGVYDGEMVTRGAAADATPAERKEHKVLVLFDVLEVDGVDVCDTPYVSRRQFIEHAVAHVNRPDVLDISRQWPDVSEATVQGIWAEGGEGAMLKKRSSTYRPGRRSKEWIKVKACEHVVLTIVGFEEGLTGPNSITVLREDATGIETTVKTRGEALREQIGNDPEAFIGRKLRIQFQEKTKYGKWRHPMWDHLLDAE